MVSVFDHPWLGALFGDREAQALWTAEAQLRHMLAFEAAWSRALAEAGLAGPEAAEIADRIAAASPDHARLAAGTARDGVPVPALVDQLRRLAPDRDMVHRGATSQDVIDTALALTLRATSALLDVRLGALETALGDLRARFGGRRMMGRTRMQAAMPIAVSRRIATWERPLAGHRSRLSALRPAVEQVQIGGAAGDRAVLGPAAPVVARSVADALGLADPGAAWHTTREGIAAYGALLAGISGTLGKMGQDLCLMAQQGVDEVAFVSGGGGSSAMPHKQNPVLAELLVTLARFNATQVSALHHGMIHEQERSGAAWSLEWMVLPQMAVATARGLGAGLDLARDVARLGPLE